MERRKHLMSGHGGLQRHDSGLTIMHLPHQNHIGILPKHGTNPSRIVQTDLRIDMGLQHGRQGIFHRILQGHNIGFSLVKMVENGVEGGGLATAGRTGD